MGRSLSFPLRAVCIQQEVSTFKATSRQVTKGPRLSQGRRPSRALQWRGTTGQTLWHLNMSTGGKQFGIKVPLQGLISSLLRFPLCSLLPSTTPRTCYPLFRTHNIHSPTHHHCHSIVMPTVLCDTPSGGSTSQLASQTGGVPQRGCQSGAFNSQS